MKQTLEKTIAELQSSWANLNMESILKIKSTMKTFSRDLPEGFERYRDPTDGFVLLAYIEDQGTYRIPHDHGNAWVIYLVISGEVEMKNYFNAIRADDSTRLILKSQEKLVAGDTRIYYPGEIHDTRCLTEKDIILRLTSLDLREEEAAGRMKRYSISPPTF